jgi:cytochrome c-type biogenesis protein CcmH/NrfF
MKQIEVFVDSIYQNVGGNRKEIQELKAEMKNHLLEAVHELISEGKSEQDAIDIAIERFGREKEMRSIVGQLFKVQKTFAKWLLYISIAFLLMGSIISGIIFNIESKKVNEAAQIATEILNKIGNKKGIPIEVESDIQSIITKSEFIYAINIYDHNMLFSSKVNVKPEYSFKKELTTHNWLLLTNYGYGESNDTWHIDIDLKNYEATATSILLLGVSIYWTLFAIWAIINEYHRKQLNIGWIIVFALFNVLGYLVYRIVGNKKITVQ